MGKKENWRLNLQQFEVISRKTNVVHLSRSASISHERKKFDIALAIFTLGHNFITDGKLTGGRGYVDVCDLDEGTIFEVVNTERKESLDCKRGKYPFPIVEVEV